MQVSLIYEDDHIVAVHKPAGLLVHRSWIDPHATEFALQQVRDLIGHHVYPVHRLDRPTSGLLLMAKSPQAAQSLGQQFESHQIGKKYLAVVRGFTQQYGLIDHALSVRLDKLADKDKKQDKAPQPAQTRYLRLATAELPFAVDRYPQSRYSLVELEPLTGRKHQLRRHMKHISHPILGDPKYGKGQHNRSFADYLHCSRLMLASTQINFVHPESQRPMTLDAPLEQDFWDAVVKLDWADAVAPHWRPTVTPIPEVNSPSPETV